jgi:hypothetical protein
MDCYLTGEDGELMRLDSGVITGAGIGCGVIVGEKSQPTNPCSYSGNMYIDYNMAFDIKDYTSAYGVYFGSTASNSTQVINGTFNIDSANDDMNGDIDGVRFESVGIAGDTTVNGTFHIYSPKGKIRGVFFNGPILLGSTQIINGTFTILGNYVANASGCGV